MAFVVYSPKSAKASVDELALEQLRDRDLALRQLLGLALARSGARERAHQVLRTLREEGHHDSETLGILARTQAEEMGHEFIELEPGEVEKIMEAAIPLHEEWIEEREAMGLPARALIEDGKARFAELQ